MVLFHTPLHFLDVLDHSRINRTRLHKALRDSDGQPNISLAQSTSQEVLGSIPTGGNFFFENTIGWNKRLHFSIFLGFS